MALLLVLLLASSAWAETLTWNANSEPDLAGYKVYQRALNTAYGAPIATIGKVTTYTTPALPVGTTAFTVTAFDTAGNESLRSNEVTAIVPPPPTPTDPAVLKRLDAIESALHGMKQALGGF